jgi:hypothetical protein
MLTVSPVSPAVSPFRISPSNSRQDSKPGHSSDGHSNHSALQALTTIRHPINHLPPEAALQALLSISITWHTYMSSKTINQGTGDTFPTRVLTPLYSRKYATPGSSAAPVSSPSQLPSPTGGGPSKSSEDKTPTSAPTKQLSNLDLIKQKIFASTWAVPSELLGGVMLNKAFQCPPSYHALVLNTFNQLSKNLNNIATISIGEIIFDRALRAVLTVKSTEHFSKEEWGLFLSILFPVLVVAGAEGATAPLNVATTRVQAGLSHSALEAIKYTIKEEGTKGLFKGSPVLFLRGLTFPWGQLMCWRGFEKLFGKNLKDMSFFQSAVTVSLGAVLGTVTSSAPTWAFFEASTTKKSIKDIFFNEILGNPRITAGKYLAPMPILSKAVTKAATHTVLFANWGKLRGESSADKKPVPSHSDARDLRNLLDNLSSIR